MKSRLSLLGLLFFALVLAACSPQGVYLNAEVTHSSAKLTWGTDEDTESVSEYIVQRSDNGDAGPFREIARVTGQQYTDENIVGGNSYAYRVRAVGTDGTSLGESPTLLVTTPTNLIVNPSFEEIDGNGNPVGWRGNTYGGQAEFELVVGGGHDGGNAVTIFSENGVDGSWMTSQTVTVEPDTLYRLSGWVKTEGVDLGSGLVGAVISIHELQDQTGEIGGRTRTLVGDNDWTYVDTVFNSGDRTTLTVLGLFGGWGQSRGTAWYDDLALSKIVKFEAKAE